MRNRKLATWAGVGLFCLLAGCGQEFVSATEAGGAGGAQSTSSTAAGQGGGQGGSTSEGGGPACDAPGGDDACAACLFDSCQDRYCACEDESDCTGLASCLEDAFPTDLCFQNNPKGIAALGSLSDCGNESCPACTLDPVDDCMACQYDKCPEPLNTCYSKGVCLGYLVCVRDCKASGGTDTACGNTCYKDGAGVSDAQALFECVAAQCGEPCML